MFTPSPSPDYLQQLFAYLQAGQQLLQQWATMSGAPQLPTNAFMPPPSTAAAYPIPTMPLPAQPAPDYAQQLFGYLQAWRQHLEQMAPTPPAPAQSPAAAPLFGAPLQATPHPAHGGGPDIPTKPDDNGSKSNVLKTQNSGPTPPPEVVSVGPAVRNSTQVPDSKRLEILIPPYLDTGNQIDRLGQAIVAESPDTSSAQATAVRHSSNIASPRAASAFTSAMSRVNPASVQPINAKSLFSQAGFDTPSG
ncbi:hypothetical protein MAIC_19940 [Mycolicibacterium aichiense]|uniref:Uncharacterized protein n=1 Tax=Mycolicibacterium aichiense TaxID=1799 RepID=A0AAD1HNQ7_9MYCO|nr:hypothetical protein [Mycolicibacterium aichiense]BBX07191.1 hypothetical protein MAIC_19940 [Mycolicibacterium aichiense]STZ81006.1 FAD dependent oxidoreductase domain-containing protein [Mycolicibacterium aichiense]